MKLDISCQHCSHIVSKTYATFYCPYPLRNRHSRGSNERIGLFSSSIYFDCSATCFLRLCPQFVLFHFNLFAFFVLVFNASFEKKKYIPPKNIFLPWNQPLTCKDKIILLIRLGSRLGIVVVIYIRHMIRKEVIALPIGGHHDNQKYKYHPFRRYNIYIHD